MPAERLNAKLVSLAVTASSALHTHFAMRAWRDQIADNPA